MVTVSLIQQSHCLKIDLSKKKWNPEIRVIPFVQIQANDGVAFCPFEVDVADQKCESLACKSDVCQGLSAMYRAVT